MIRRPPRSTQSRSSAASDVYKRQVLGRASRHEVADGSSDEIRLVAGAVQPVQDAQCVRVDIAARNGMFGARQDAGNTPVSYTHLRAHETRHDLVCRLLLEKK